MEYLTKPGRVWQRIGSDELLGERLSLKGGEELKDFRQTLKPKQKQGKQSAPKRTVHITGPDVKFDGGA